VPGYAAKRSMAGNDYHRIDMNMRYVRWRLVFQLFVGFLAQASSRSSSVLLQRFDEISTAGAAVLFCR
jgi:hypothetical protein